MASVVVVGAGIAGLCCAFRLQLAGHRVELLERESIPGGRLQSEALGDFRVERGAECISRDDHNLHGLLAALELRSCVRDIAPSDSAVFSSGRFAEARWSSPAGLLRSSALTPLSRARFARLVLDLARHRRQLDPLHPERANELDREDADRYFTRAVGRDARDALVAPLLSHALSCDMRDLSQACALSALGQQASSPVLQTLDGGLGRIAESLAERVPVRTGCEVVSVYNEREGARVAFCKSGRDRVVVADAVVVALPAPRVPELCQKLTPEERGFFESVHFARGIVVHLVLDEEPRGMTHYRACFSRRDGFDLYGATAAHRRPGAAPRGAGLLRAAFTADASARVWDASDAEISGLVCENLARTPIGAVTPIAAAVHRHPLMLPLASPGSGRRLASFLTRGDRSPRLAFAGDYLVGQSVEAAVTSGMRAATEIAHSLHLR